MAQLRVFVSSVMEGFGPYRDAACRGIEAAGCHAVRIEQFPSLGYSPRNACLNAVESCDAIVVIVGERGGWIAPSGQLVVEEEYQYAKSLGLPTLVFLQDVDRDAEGERLAKLLSDFVEGAYRTTFKTERDLEVQVEASCRHHHSCMESQPMANEQFDGLLNARCPFSDEPVLRLVVGPDRHDRVVVPIDKLDDAEFRRAIVMLAIEPSIGLFHYNSAREEDRGNDSLIILQGDSARRGPSQGRRVRVELTSGGVLVIDIGLRRNDGSLAGIPFAPVEVERIQEDAAVSIRFALRVYKEIDPFGRYAILLFNARLENLGYHNLSYRTPRAGASTQIRMSQSDQPYIAFALPERLSRSDATLADIFSRKISSALERRVNVQDRGTW